MIGILLIYLESNHGCSAEVLAEVYKIEAHRTKEVPLVTFASEPIKKVPLFVYKEQGEEVDNHDCLRINSYIHIPKF